MRCTKPQEEEEEEDEEGCISSSRGPSEWYSGGWRKEEGKMLGEGKAKLELVGGEKRREGREGETDYRARVDGRDGIRRERGNKRRTGGRKQKEDGVRKIKGRRKKEEG